MPKRKTAPVGAPCWVDLMTSDQDRSRAFYGELFGWTAEDPEPDFGGYLNFRKDGVRIAGCMSNAHDPDKNEVWSVYLASEDATATTEAAAAAGGQVVVAAMPVADLGSMAYVTDPGRAAVGIWQPGRHPGFGTYGEPGTPAWFELHTRDYEPSVDFYRDVFGLETRVESDTPEFRYTTLGRAGEQLAGIMDAAGVLPDGVPAHWSVYFAVADADEAVAKVVDLGGSVVLAPKDTPYGRLASAADPTGARFKVVSGP